MSYAPVMPVTVGLDLSGQDCNSGCEIILHDPGVGGIGDFYLKSLGYQFSFEAPYQITFQCYDSLYTLQTFRMYGGSSDASGNWRNNQVTDINAFCTTDLFYYGYVDEGSLTITATAVPVSQAMATSTTEIVGKYPEQVLYLSSVAFLLAVFFFFAFYFKNR